jgi:hypothetical protein
LLLEQSKQLFLLHFRPTLGGWRAYTWQAEIATLLIGAVLISLTARWILVPALIYNRDKLWAMMKEIWQGGDYKQL